MPNVDETAKAWQTELSLRVGDAVQHRRKALNLTAQQLAERTKDLGYPVTRVAISKIEKNLRAGKLDVAELLVLAVALEIPPALLLSPTYPEGTVELLPGYESWVPKAVDWLSGKEPLPVKVHADGTTGEIQPSNDGVVLVGAFARRNGIEARLLELRMKADRDKFAPDDMVDKEFVKRSIQDLQTQRAAVEREIRQATDALWGGPVEDAHDG